MSKLLVILVALIVAMAALTMGQLPQGCTCATPDTLIPVCGNDGITYPNIETLRCANDCVKYSIHLMHNGPCRT